MNNSFRLKKESVEILKWSLMIFPLIKPGYINYLDSLNTIYNFARIVSLLIILLLWMAKINFKEFIVRPVCYVIFFQFYIFIITCLRNQDIKNSLLLLFAVIALSLVITYSMEKNSRVCIHALLFVYEVYVYANLVSLIFYPEGMYDIGSDRISTFLGHANTSIYFILPLLTLDFLYYKNERKKLRLVLDFAVSIISIILIGSATSIVEFCVFIVLAFLVNKRKQLGKILNLRNAFWGSVVLSILITVFQIQARFSFFIEMILHRTLDFSGRTILWKYAIVDILNNPLWGYGIRDARYRRFGMGTHNMLLELLYEGGIIGFLLFVLIIYKIYNLSVRRERFNENGEIYIICALIAQLIGGLTESNIASAFFYTLIILALNSNNLVNYITKRKERSK